jgi:hypothetical protein
LGFFNQPIQTIKSAYGDWVENGFKAARAAGKASKEGGKSWMGGAFGQIKKFLNGTDLEETAMAHAAQQWEKAVQQAGGEQNLAAAVGKLGPHVANKEAFTKHFMDEWRATNADAIKSQVTTRRVAGAVGAVGAVGVGTGGVRLVSGRSPFRDQEGNADLPGIPFL